MTTQNFLLSSIQEIMFPIGSNKDELHFIAIGFILIKIKSFQVLMIKIINKHLNKNIQKENQNQQIKRAVK